MKSFVILQLILIAHLQFWPTEAVQKAVKFQQMSGYVAGWSKVSEPAPKVPRTGYLRSVD